jgi:hypothetical protein
MDLRGDEGEDALVFGQRTHRQILQPYRNQNGDERADALAPALENMFQQPLPGLSRADSYSVQTIELEKSEEQLILNQVKEIIKNHDNYYKDESVRAALNREFVNPNADKKTVNDYKDILKRANKAKVTLDIDGAIVYTLAYLVRVEQLLSRTYGEMAVSNIREIAHNLEENIYFLMKIPKSPKKNDFKQRVKNFNTALFNLIVSNTLSDEGYNLILTYASNQNIDVKVKSIKRSLRNKQISTPTEFSNKRGGSQTGGMWQQGGFFMTCS